MEQPSACPGDKPRVEYYMLKDDFMAPVYEIDFSNQTWRLVGSRIGVVDAGGSISSDGGSRFLTDKYLRVWKVADDGPISRFSLDCPAASQEMLSGES